MNQIFELIKKQDFATLKEYLNKNSDINLDIKDENNNYLIHNIIIFNQLDIMKIILERGIRLDRLDSDGYNILYIPIKFNYIDILELLLLYNKKLIGISILDLKDKLGNTILSYAILKKNSIIIKLLYNNGANIFERNNNNKNNIELILIENIDSIIYYFLDNNININFISFEGDSLLQILIYYQKFKIIKLLLKKKIELNINNQDFENGITALHQSIIINKFSITKALINHNADINLCDFYGNSALIYGINENNLKSIKKLIKNKNLNYNLTNIDGNTGLHLFFIKNKSNLLLINEKNILLLNLITKTDLTIQNNNGDTCLHYIIEYNLLIKYKDLLVTKELNIFIKNLQNITPYILINNNLELINIIIDSYYNFLKNNNSDLLIDWEVKCGNLINNEIFCKKKISDIIIKEHRSIPKIKNDNIILDVDQFINTCYYTGSPFDILCGLLFLSKTFKKINIEILLESPLSNNIELLKYYKMLGIDYNYNTEFCNFEINWSYQKLFFPTYFDEKIIKKIKQCDYIIIPIGIEIANTSHANIIFWDIKKKIIERFEPNGSNQPIGLNYNNNILDKLLINKFKTFDNDIEYIAPKDYLPVIGFQILENKNEILCTRIGDPNGFCAIWCIWWVYQKLKNLKIDSKTLAYKLIQKIKYNNINFKTLIRNFSNNIVEIRDNFLKKFDLDINDWINNNYDEKISKNLELDILQFYKK